MQINYDAYYRGLAAEKVQGLADQLLTLAGDAERNGADGAARDLADLSTQLLDIGLEVDQTGPGAPAG